MAKKLSPILAELRRILLDGVKRIDNDECNEAQAMGMLNGFNSESKGFYNKESFVNYDRAMKKLGIKTRNTFKDICEAYGIEQKTINNQKVGFLKSEIEYLATILNKRKEGGND